MLLSVNEKGFCCPVGTFGAEKMTSGIPGASVATGRLDHVSSESAAKPTITVMSVALALTELCRVFALVELIVLTTASECSRRKPSTNKGKFPHA